jgi:hypothetical protein
MTIKKPVINSQNPKKEMLISFSKVAKKLRQDMAEGATDQEEAFFWASRTVNFMLLNHVYATDEATEFNTFNQWKERGTTIKKGSKAFAIWGQPIAGRKPDKKTEPDQEPDEYEYFPMCFLFSDKQVITAEGLEAERQKAKEAKEKRPETETVNQDFQTVQLD